MIYRKRKFIYGDIVKGKNNQIYIFKHYMNGYTNICEVLNLNGTYLRHNEEYFKLIQNSSYIED